MLNNTSDRDPYIREIFANVSDVTRYADFTSAKVKFTGHHVYAGPKGTFCNGFLNTLALAMYRLSDGPKERLELSIRDAAGFVRKGKLDLPNINGRQSKLLATATFADPCKIDVTLFDFRGNVELLLCQTVEMFADVISSQASATEDLPEVEDLAPTLDPPDSE